MKHELNAIQDQLKTVAPPRGERGLKHRLYDGYMKLDAVAPPRGERGLKLPQAVQAPLFLPRRSPSWGARIEIDVMVPRYAFLDCRSPSWGARIEIFTDYALIGDYVCSRSPSWGARIEICHSVCTLCMWRGRSPSWGARIEIYPYVFSTLLILVVAPPRGERGLK